MWGISPLSLLQDTPSTGQEHGKNFMVQNAKPGPRQQEGQRSGEGALLSVTVDRLPGLSKKEEQTLQANGRAQKGQLLARVHPFLFPSPKFPTSRAKKS